MFNLREAGRMMSGAHTRAAALSIYRQPKNKHCFANEFTNGMRASVPIILLSLIFASGHCCSVVISQPLHLSATVSPEFSIAVAQPSNLSVSIDGSYIFNESVSGNINFALQARSPLPTTSNYAISNFLFQELWPGTHALSVTANCFGARALIFETCIC